MLYWTCHRTISIRDFLLTQEPNFFSKKRNLTPRISVACL
nr:MAG TPA: hypothetical protein [Caudoviricetes sp.]